MKIKINYIKNEKDSPQRLIVYQFNVQNFDLHGAKRGKYQTNSKEK
jgi:hypothetical protein